MHFETEDYVEQPVDLVYPLVRDQMADLLPYLPNVEQVTQLSYERVSETRVDVVNQWKAKAQIPAVAQRFLPPDLLTWTDTARWDDDALHVEYTLNGFGYEARGINSFHSEGSGTRIRISATVTIQPERFKVPRLLFKKVFPVIEGLIRESIEPNMTALSRALGQYFANR